MLFRKPYQKPELKRLIACQGDLPCIFRQSFSIPVPLCPRCNIIEDLMMAHGDKYSLALRLVEEVER
jgi:hypothetical protein